MERPYQFSDDRDGARSPFNQNLLNPAAQPAGTSFKTNVNRSKTRKWAEAKNYSYDGDDWGGYDPYDEYGSYDDKQDAPLPAAAPRRNSFETGEEVRSFSSGQQQPPPPAPPAHITPTKPQPLQPAVRPQADQGVRRDFSQIAHVPPPLKTNTSPQVVRERFPARKSSLQTSLPSSPAQTPQQPALPEPVSPILSASAAPSAGKALPFIRPADIYKRMEEERLREQEAKNQVAPVPARREEHQGFEDIVPAKSIDAGIAGRETTREEQPATASLGSALPAVSRVASGFGSEFWNASELSSSLNAADSLSPTTTNTEPVAPPETNSLEDASHELTNAVNQAFERRDDLSVPPTPISRDNSQSGHGSDTAGISPIMSRVPSATTAEAKARLVDNRNMGPIAEEGSAPGSPGSRPPSSQQQLATKRRTPTHSRNVSAESFNNSPARTPQLEYTKRLSTPMSAESSSLEEERAVSPIDSPSKPLPIASVRVIAPSADYSRRESDIAADASSSSPIDTAEAAKAARANFLQTHERVTSPVIGSPIERSSSPISRQGSPGPSRVRDLAGKYNELHTLSRSSSAMSFNSQKSDRSLKRTGTWDSTNSEASGVTNDDRVVDSIESASLDRPDPTRGASFRPHLPGEWVSYVGTPSTEMPVAQQATRRSVDDIRDHPQLDQVTPRQATFPSPGDFDPTPATVKQPLAHRDIQPKEPSPVDTLKNAGEALGAALLSSFGQNHGTRDFAQPEQQSPEEDFSAPRRSVGDVYLRPLTIGRKASSIASSVGPTPPAKDTPDGLGLQGSSGYFPPPTLRVDSDAMTPGSDYSPADLESDRLRREIERSLTPQVHSEDQQIRNQDALHAPATLRETQETEGLQVHKSQSSSNEPTVPQTSNQAADAGLLGKRFSFERDQSNSSLWGEVGEEVKRASYERPLSGVGLQVINTNVSSSSSEWDDSSVEDVPAEAIEEPSEAPLQPAETPLQPTEAPLQPTEAPLQPIVGPLPPMEGPLPPMEGPSPPTEAPSQPTEASRQPFVSLPSLITSPVHTSAHTRDVKMDDEVASPTVRLPTALEKRIGEQPPPVYEESETPIYEKTEPLAPVATTETPLAPTETPLTPTATTSSTAATNTAARIPTVREIMALKTVDERVNTYNSSREQVASMDTGLSNWLSSTLSSHPEHAHVITDAANKPAGTTAIGGSIRYKPQPGNIMKLARKGLSGVTNREPSGSYAADPSQTPSVERQTSNTPGRSPSAQQGGVPKMQTKGKDLLHSAGMFGGKATVGAKGLFARAKGRLREGGSEKVD
ncbi:hypothetical protein E4T50_07332 [Aureobasidium sp. EXF-12298]|nr:hypothetical protein E4T50_07332 [Aureobasidium sp. EXF-12298]